jgi:hypothetical protein
MERGPMNWEEVWIEFLREKYSRLPNQKRLDNLYILYRYLIEKKLIPVQKG